MSPNNQDLSNDTTFSQIKSRVPVPLILLNLFWIFMYPVRASTVTRPFSTGWSTEACWAGKFKFNQQKTTFIFHEICLSWKCLFYKFSITDHMANEDKISNGKSAKCTFYLSNYLWADRKKAIDITMLNLIIDLLFL